jgi:hypothetical protein
VIAESCGAMQRRLACLRRSIVRIGSGPFVHSGSLSAAHRQSTRSILSEGLDMQPMSCI